MDDFMKALDDLLCDFYHLGDKDLTAKEKTEIDTEVEEAMHRLVSQQKNQK